MFQPGRPGGQVSLGARPVSFGHLAGSLAARGRIETSPGAACGDGSPPPRCDGLMVVRTAHEIAALFADKLALELPQAAGTAGAEQTGVLGLGRRGSVTVWVQSSWARNSRCAFRQGGPTFAEPVLRGCAALGRPFTNISRTICSRLYARLESSCSARRGNCPCGETYDRRVR